MHVDSMYTVLVTSPNNRMVKSLRMKGGGHWLRGPSGRRLDGGSSLQVLLDLGGVFAVEALRLLVELGVPLVDVVDVGVVVVRPAPAVLGPLLDPGMAKDRSALIMVPHGGRNAMTTRTLRRSCKPVWVPSRVLVSGPSQPLLLRRFDASLQFLGCKRQALEVDARGQ